MQSNKEMSGQSGDQTSTTHNINSDPRQVVKDDPATPLHTCFAKVYTMNPNNQIWIGATKSPVPISFYFDKHRSVYRIISYEGSNIVINSTVLPTMTFLLSSSKFGLWSDSKLRTIFGLGFANQKQLHEMNEWFVKVVKAAATLENCIPLPPPASTAISYGDSSWSQDVGTNFPSNDQLVPPKSVHLVDSKINLANIPQCYQLSSEEDSFEYEMEEGRSKIANLALRSLQCERETAKSKQLESELLSMRNSLTSMHENLQRKGSEIDRLKKELTEAKAELNNKAKIHEDDKKNKDSIDKVKDELFSVKASLQEKIASASKLQKENEEINKENGILKERLRQTENELESVDKNWDLVEIVSSDLTDKIQGLVEIQSRLRLSLPSNTSGKL